ncbi:major facilitator superfamily transporter [Aaosphaeria arxii CBS 175.79]|uniref:Major facilitator superfamily transporter n=1 Tax=Aaosphaeria arxii CBS 175.79 TaxID=1450172 RepID=A0A6A5X7E1_9PLEO|nr:major facilitator superfamily transporter [Aaosphaeria arxii CBS 175.79]KAF2008826.1 major facilitator superfamily transporter [Aaosphaeria arxii CBS 175.79]
MSPAKDDASIKNGFAQDIDDFGHSQGQLSPSDDRRILRQIDMNLLPVMAVSYLFQFLDKSALGFTAILSLRKDLHVTGLEYSWANSIYYFGYLVASYPMGWLLVRLPVGRLIAGSIFVWGAILMLTSTCSNSGGLLANRFFLGASESAIGPGLTVIVAMWYKRSEQPLRHGAWYLGNTTAGVFGGLVGYGVGHINTIAPWKAVFLIFGACTVIWSAVVYFFLPDTPSNARFLNEEDRVKAIERVRENMTGIKSDEWKWKQSFEAFLDIKVWLLFIIQITSQIANGGIHGFGSIIIKGFGFTTLNTLLVQIIAYVFQFVFVAICTVGSTYLKNSRTYFMAWNLAIALTGAAMIREVHKELIWARFMGYCLAIGYSANFPMILSMSSGNVAGFTKKTTVNAMIFIAYCAGNIIGPQLFIETEAPGYSTGFLSMLICFGIGIVACFILRFYLVWENKRRDGQASDGMAEEDMDAGMLDRTDKEIKSFRYVY